MKQAASTPKFGVLGVDPVILFAPPMGTDAYRANSAVNQHLLEFGNPGIPPDQLEPIEDLLAKLPASITNGPELLRMWHDCPEDEQPNLRMVMIRAFFKTNRCTLQRLVNQHHIVAPIGGLARMN
jgi:hypothetical protein